eukprot:15332964-Ditylum_brightwellii.AAC.1
MESLPKRIYVLDGKLQSQTGGVPKWEPCAQVGINRGNLSAHACNVHLILNPRTGHMSPQYCVVFDNTFSTIPYLQDGTVPPFWSELVETSTERATEPHQDAASQGSTQSIVAPSMLHALESPLDLSENPGPDQDQFPSVVSKPSSGCKGESILKMPNMIDVSSAGLKCSACTLKPTQQDVTWHFGCSLDRASRDPNYHVPTIYYHAEVASSLFHKTIKNFSPMAFAANQQQNEMYTYQDMLKQPDAKDFVVAILKETGVHEDRNHWTQMKRSNAELDINVYMELPIGMTAAGENSKDYVLKLNKSIYGLRQSSLNWFNLLSGALQKEIRNFVPSQVDPYLFVWYDFILLTYVDDVLIIGKSKEAINSFITSLELGNENFEFTREGTIMHYLGLIELIEFTSDVKSRDNPVKLPLLHKDLNGLVRKQTWSYRSAVSMMSYLQGSTCPEIAMVMQQCARFCNNLVLLHEQAVRMIVKHLSQTADRGIIYCLDPKLGIQCYVDADFAGDLSKADADNPEKVMSRSSFIILYAGCPVLWQSKLQTEIALSTSESEYISLSSAMQEVIPFMNLLEELSKIINSVLQLQSHTSLAQGQNILP